MMQLLSRFFAAISSLRLTLFCLAAALVLVFAGTMAQVHFDPFFVQEQYFQSWIVWWIPASGAYKIPMFPGGHFIGAVLLLNLIAAHIRRFSWTWRKLGIQLTHVGLIIMLAGGLATDLFSVSSFMSLKEGETKDYSESAARRELAVADDTDPNSAQVTTIPGEVLAKGGEIKLTEPLPFKIVVRSYFRNSLLNQIGVEKGSTVPSATNGVGQHVAVTSIPRATKVKEQDTMSAVVEIIPTKDGKSLGTWMVSDALAVAQEFELEGRRWTLHLRPVRYYKNYSLTLNDFVHEVYPGTQMPKDFSSNVTLNDPAIKDSRQVRIWMNHPLRYQGDTYYQSSFLESDSGTVLQVVRNPSYQAPYIACVIVGIGLLYQFTLHLAGFVRRAKPTPAP
jgi:hypothetical protein